MAVTIAKKLTYHRRHVGYIHAGGSVKYAPLPNFFERTVQHEAQIYCRYWFGEDYSIEVSDKESTIDSFAERPKQTTVVVVNTHRNETNYVYHSKFLAYLEAENPEPTDVFLLASPHYHLEGIFLWIFRGPSPEEAEWPEADLARMAGAMKSDDNYAIHPDQIANDMYDQFGQTKMIEGAIHYYGRSVPTKWTPYMSAAEAPKYYKHASE